MVLFATQAAVFLAVFLLGLGIGEAVRRPVTLKERLAGFAFHAPAVDTPPARRLAFLTAVGKMMPRRYLAKKEAGLRDADIQLSAAEFMGIQIVLVLGSALLLTLVVNVWSGVAAGIVTLAVLNLLVEVKRRTRQSMIDEQLIEALGVMTGAVRAGYSLQQAMMMVAEEAEDPIRGVFQNFVTDLGRGVVMEDALDNMAAGTRNPDIELMTVAIRINRQIGGNISEILELIQATVIDRIKLKKNVKTLTAQGRLSGIIVSLLPVGIGLMIYVIDPAYMGVLFKSPIGLAMLTASGVMMLMGALVIRRILDLGV